MAERTLVVDSISKTGRATGWRIGWVLTPPRYTRRLRAVHDNLVVQAPTPLQKGAVALLRQERTFFDGIAGDYRRKRDLLVAGLRTVGFAVTPPEGAYYLFADYRTVPTLAEMPPADAAMHLVKQVGVATVPGDNFYTTGGEPLSQVRVLPIVRDAGSRRRAPARRTLSGSARFRTAAGCDPLTARGKRAPEGCGKRNCNETRSTQGRYGLSGTVFTDSEIANQLANVSDLDFGVLSFAVTPERKPAVGFPAVADPVPVLLLLDAGPGGALAEHPANVLEPDDGEGRHAYGLWPMPRGRALGRAR